MNFLVELSFYSEFNLYNFITLQRIFRVIINTNNNDMSGDIYFCLNININTLIFNTLIIYINNCFYLFDLYTRINPFRDYTLKYKEIKRETKNISTITNAGGILSKVICTLHVSLHLRATYKKTYAGHWNWSRCLYPVFVIYLSSTLFFTCRVVVSVTDELIQRSRK